MTVLPDTSSMYIGGAWVRPATTAQLTVTNPSTETVLATVAAGTSADVDAAVAAARRALPAWSRTSPRARGLVLRAVRDALDARRDELTELVVAEVGTPAKIAAAVQVGLPITVLDGYLDLLETYEFQTRIGTSTIIREAVGVVGAITPWNYPLHQTVAKVIPALAAGCTVVHKPSEVAPLTAFVLAQIIADSGLPPGVFNMVCGTGTGAGAALVAHPDVDMISFTGSTAAGRAIGAAAALTVKRVALELGGKSANVVLDDADLGTAVRGGVQSAFLNSGQTCTALSRLLVHEDQYEEAVALAVNVADGLASRLGPLATQEQWDRVQKYIQLGIAEGATVAAGGIGRPDGKARGYYCRPTVLSDVGPGMRVSREEIFGPVLCVMRYADEDEAVEIANGTPYGLAAAVWSATVERAMGVASRLRAGQVDINGARFNPLAPFGGYKQSGNGRELGTFGLAEFLETKSVQLP
jgi:acyl-CoA reductase-like NAD-dependent aldehyde dehydrogenase